MLTLIDLYKQLDINSKLMTIALSRKDDVNYKRMVELNTHRTEILKCIIDKLTIICDKNQYKKVG